TVVLSLSPVPGVFLLFLSGERHAAHAEEGASSERNCSSVPPYLPPTAVNTTLRLLQLRAAMKPHNISAYIIPGTDAHLSEYIAPYDARLAWMSGFSGSAGTAVVTQDKAVLWTDSRYWVQAERQMDCNWELERDVSVSSITNWLIKETKEGDEVGFDPFLFSVDTFARPPLPPDSLTRLPDEFIGVTWQNKVDQIRGQMMDNPYKPTALLLSALDETACKWYQGRFSVTQVIELSSSKSRWLDLWCNLEDVQQFLSRGCYSSKGRCPQTFGHNWLFNLRGNDIPFNPFFYSYTLLTFDKIWLFVHTERVTEELKVYLNSSCDTLHCVQLLNYDSVREHLMKYLEEPGVRVWVGTEYTNQALYELITPEGKLLQSTYSPVLTTKAVKVDTEQRILREAHIRDAVAVMQLLLHLERAVPEGMETELTAAEFVNECRSKQKYSRGPSFETISASGPNAALAHYSPSKETARQLRVDEMYLVDSGGQYLDGTTDITRTVHWGKPTALQKDAFTRVLKGNIEISRTIFPAGTKGVNIEMLGRRALWEVGLNYGHGTGHGVGNYFGVHEWPVGFQSNNIPFQEGMFTSIEPGYYKENDFGIRIEDIALARSIKTEHGNNYLTFETVSLVPYDRKLINTTILSLEQLVWLDSYYRVIREKVGPELKSQGLTEVYDWMIENTQPFLTDGASAVVASMSPLLLLLLLPLALL
uniref:X-prolyl aminopeptidase (aminopeptidase P) 2, membrane-bound n=1 Tax=Pygocentrus nattereri TaxID=42514 RepID=A0AAR2L1A2_PYGNA